MPTEFTAETATEALAEASEALRAAGVTGLWLDLDGAGWTGTYLVYVEATTSITEMRATRHLLADGSTVPLEKNIAWTSLADATKAAVQTALAGLDVGPQMVLEIKPLQNSNVLSVNALVWPPVQRCRALQVRIAALQAQLAVWQRREQYDLWEPPT